MLYSAALAKQKIAWAVSEDLIHWKKGGLCNVPVIDASVGNFGAPFIIEELVRDGLWHMIYQGKDINGRMSFILLESNDLINWY